MAEFRMVDRTKRENRNEPAFEDVDFGDSIVFLAGDIGEVALDGDELGLHVLANGGASRAGDADARNIGAGEMRELHFQMDTAAACDVDDRNRSLGIRRVVLGGLALVGNDEFRSVRVIGEHVGMIADLDRTGGRAVLGEEHHAAALALVVRGHRHGDFIAAGVGTDVHAVRIAEGGQVDRLDEHRSSGIGGVKDINRVGRTVDNEHALGDGVELDDLGSGRVEEVRRIAIANGGDRGEAQGLRDERSLGER